MDQLRAGKSVRALRLRKAWRQEDLAGACGLSRSQVGRVERGELQGVPVDDLLAIGNALGADLDVRYRWHGEGLDRLLDEHHASLVDEIVRRLRALGWECAVEASFSIYGERGSVDVLAWHAATRTILVIEVKTVVPDAGSMLLAHDRKTRLARQIGAQRGWDALEVARVLVVPTGSTSRRRVQALASIFDTAYPARTVAVRRWLASPAGSISGLWFVPFVQGDGVRQGRPGRQRVHKPKQPPESPK